MQLHFDFGIVLLGKAGVGLKILEKLVYQEACSVISQLQVHFDSKIGLLSRGWGRNCGYKQRQAISIYHFLEGLGFRLRTGFGFSGYIDSISR